MSIDSHCHLEQKEYSNLDNVIQECKKNNITALITCCANPSDFDFTISLTKKYKNYVFAVAGLHPEYIKEFSLSQVSEYLKKIKQNSKNLIGLGETGLDFFWVKEEAWRKKQIQLFRKFILLSKELNLPLTIHSRDAHGKTLEILKSNSCERVHWHMFGAKELLNQLPDSWVISIGPLLLKSKTHQKIVRDFPIEKILLETDSPWFQQPDQSYGLPTNIIPVAKKIAEIKKLSFEDVWQACGRNTSNFYKIPL